MKIKEEMRRVADAASALGRHCECGTFDTISRVAKKATSWDEFWTEIEDQVVVPVSPHNDLERDARQAVALAKTWRPAIKLDRALCLSADAGGRPVVEDGAEFGLEYQAVSLSLLGGTCLIWKEAQCPEPEKFLEVSPKGIPLYGLRYGRGEIWAAVVGPVMEAAAEAVAVMVSRKGSFVSVVKAREALILDVSMNDGYHTVRHGRAPSTSIMFFREEIAVDRRSGGPEHFGSDCITLK